MFFFRRRLNKKFGGEGGGRFCWRKTVQKSDFMHFCDYHFRLTKFCFGG